MRDGHVLAAIDEHRQLKKTAVAAPPVKVVAAPNKGDDLLASLVVDGRNDVLVSQSLQMLLVVASAAALFYHFSWFHAAIHIGLVLHFATAYVAILHNASHRALYAPHAAVMELLVPYVLGPVLGHTWYTYYFHHVKHHHVEDNGPDDLSST